jgi:hypothetical protein
VPAGHYDRSTAHAASIRIRAEAFRAIAKQLASRCPFNGLGEPHQWWLKLPGAATIRSITEIRRAGAFRLGRMTTKRKDHVWAFARFI